MPRRFAAGSKGHALRTTARTWHLRPHDRGAVDRLGREAGVTPVVAQLLLNRGISDAEQAKRFLMAPFKGLHDPCLLPGAAAAAERILAAVRENRRICVYGDYDVDGLTGTSLLWQGLRLARLPRRLLRAAPHRGGLRPERRGAAAHRPVRRVAGSHRRLRHRQRGRGRGRQEAWPRAHHHRSPRAQGAASLPPTCSYIRACPAPPIPSAICPARASPSR